MRSFRVITRCSPPLCVFHDSCVHISNCEQVYALGAAGCFVMDLLLRVQKEQQAMQLRGTPAEPCTAPSQVHNGSHARPCRLKVGIQIADFLSGVSSLTM